MDIYELKKIKAGCGGGFFYINTEGKFYFL